MNFWKPSVVHTECNVRLAGELLLYRVANDAERLAERRRKCGDAASDSLEECLYKLNEALLRLLHFLKVAKSLAKANVER